ncbi:MAG: hypothetical protein GF307_12775, partial [candidate division Zixibacteria bacterium]|nr:hypothetical protein [candidate division Zixibacteria bacterium]
MGLHQGNSRNLKPYLPSIILEQKRDGFSSSIEVLEGSLMFADISGFTAISEKLSRVGKSGSEELTTIINRHLSGMVSIITAHGGDILKFGGDATLVYFDDIKLAAKAAFAVNNWATENSFVKTSAGKFELSLHTGLHYGKFFSAEVGDPEVKLEHIVTGHALNEVFNAADYAEGGEVGATAEFITAADGLVEQYDSKGGYFLINPTIDIDLRAITEHDIDWDNLDVELLSKFLPHGLYDKISTGRGAMVSGEHRNVTV